MTAPVVVLDNIYKSYRMGEIMVPALKGVNLTIQRGEMVAIMGPSGSGKSTLLHILGCLDTPDTGKYYLDGMEVQKLREAGLSEIRNKRIGFVFQFFNLLPRATALSNVELPLIYAGASGRRQRAAEALARVGLAHRIHHRPTALSGGEQQRVAIARALVNRPSLILADEPTGNLDSVSSQDIMSLFQELNSEGITLAIVTHEPTVSAVASRIIRLRDGQVVAEEDPRQ